ncbi:MAG TPA: hypothetical protein VIJ93_00740, partial [bacterium]
MKNFICLFVSACLIASLPTQAIALCATMPGRDGSGNISGVVNTYYPATASAAASALAINVGASTGSATPIAIGDLLLVIQMQDTDCNYTNLDSYGDGVAGTPASGYTALNSTGLYEYVVATTAVAAGVVSITGTGGGGGLVHSYVSSAYVAGTHGQQTFQVIRVPQYSGITLTSTLTCSAWNGSSGGVLALDVSYDMNLGGALVSVDGNGFRGGGPLIQAGGGAANTQYRRNAGTGNFGAKGEGIAGTPKYVYNSAAGVVILGVEGYPNGSAGWGAPANAGGGGNDSNTAANNQNAG